jgi:heme-degrading monooxygenase HmoA
MMVIAFRSRIRTDFDAQRAEQLGQRMYELAAAMPGFVSYKEFAASDGESLTLVEFETQEQLLAWRNHPEHAAAQEWGRRELFESYEITVNQTLRRYRFSRAEGRSEVG